MYFSNIINDSSIMGFEESNQNFTNLAITYCSDCINVNLEIGMTVNIPSSLAGSCCSSITGNYALTSGASSCDWFGVSGPEPIVGCYLSYLESLCEATYRLFIDLVVYKNGDDCTIKCVIYITNGVDCEVILGKSYIAERIASAFDLPELYGYSNRITLNSLDTFNDECCPESREITLSGLQGPLSIFNGVHEFLLSTIPTEYDGIACSYYLQFEIDETTILAACPCFPEPYPVFFDMNLSVDGAGLYDFSLVTASSSDVAIWRDDGYLGFGPEDNHQYLSCDPDEYLDGTAGWSIELTPASNTIPCVYTDCLGPLPSSIELWQETTTTSGCDCCNC